MKKRIFTILLAVMTLASCFNVAIAQDGNVDSTLPTGVASVDPYYTDECIFIDSQGSRATGLVFVDAEISSWSSRTLKVYVKVTGSSVMQRIGLQSLVLQKWYNGKWNDDYSWGGMKTTNASQYVFSVQSAAVYDSGAEYRIVGVAFAVKTALATQTRSFQTPYIACR